MVLSASLHSFYSSFLCISANVLFLRRLPASLSLSFLTISRDGSVAWISGSVYAGPGPISVEIQGERSGIDFAALGNCSSVIRPASLTCLSVTLSARQLLSRPGLLSFPTVTFIARLEWLIAFQQREQTSVPLVLARLAAMQMRNSSRRLAPSGTVT